MTLTSGTSSSRKDELVGLAAASSSDPVFKDLHKYLNMDVLYRSSETPQGQVTYTPRLISIDCQVSLKIVVGSTVCWRMQGPLDS